MSLDRTPRATGFQQQVHQPRSRLQVLVLLTVLSTSLLALLPSPTGADEPKATGAQPRWWKGNIHTHSFWSDGTDFPEMIVDWYRQRDYNFLALSDHNVLSEGVKWMKFEQILQRATPQVLDKYRQRFGKEWVETRGEPNTPEFEVRLKTLEEFRGKFEKPGEFLLVQGEEISDRVQGKPVHMNATNIQEVLQPLGGATVSEAIENNLRAVNDQARRLGREMLVHLNHPNFGLAVTAEDLAAAVSERYFEVYNGHPGVGHLGDANHPAVEQLWDIANTIRLGQLQSPPLMGVATDDSHEYHGRPGSRPGRGWVMVRSRELDPDKLILAMKAGDFYASSGVTLSDVQFDERQGKLSLSIEAEEGVRYETRFIGTPIDFDRTVRPRTDAAGKPIAATAIYSNDIGTVLATVSGTQAEYQLTGRELYVRAVVTSSKPHPDPSFKDQTEQAWTQPVGWKKQLETRTRR